MKSSVLQSEIVCLKSLDNLFIEMTEKSCPQHCKHCYINFPQYKKVEDYIPVEIVEEAVNSIKDNVKCIYLTGAEPMTHPNFNNILRICLKKTNVCICTNGFFINEKKARFLKKVSEETPNEIIFKVSIDHYEEIKNDDIRYRGAFRQAMFAIKSLAKYNFVPIVVVTNYYQENESDLYRNFKTLFEKNNLDLDKSHLQVIPWHDKNTVVEDELKYSNQHLDCIYGRILTAKGIYSCPFLSNDARGRCGSNLDDYNKKCAIETNFCSTCLKSNSPIFGIEFSDFE